MFQGGNRPQEAPRGDLGWPKSRAPGAKPHEQLQRRSEACQREALPGRRARDCGRSRRRRRGARNSHGHRPLLCGRGLLVGVAYANNRGSPANHGARGGAGLGPDADRRAGSGRGRLELAERFCSQFFGLRIRCVRLRETGSSGRPAEVRRGPGARSLRRRPPPAAPSQRTPCIRSLPRPRATAIPSFP